MPGYDIELLKASDDAHIEAGVAFDKKYQELLEAQKVEAETGAKRFDRYNEAFAGGLIIERITEPSKLTYHAGFRQSFFGYFMQPEDIPVYLELDELHSESLIEAVATNVRVSAFKRMFRQISDGSRAQLDKWVDFSVHGTFENELVEDNVRRSNEAATYYSGELSVIEWRLPTPDELLAFET